MIIAAGDSFIWGSELNDCRDQPSKHTFTALLAGTDEYVCVAWPGSANNSITRMAMTACERYKDKSIGIIVSWTFSTRYEFRFAYDTKQRTGNWYSINPWTINEDTKKIEQEFVTMDKDILGAQLETIKRAKATGVADFAKTFYTHVGSTEYWEVYSSLKEIVFLQNYLQLNKIPYLFTCADMSMLNNHTIENADYTIKSLVNQIDMSKWYTFDNKGFYHWARDNKYKIGTTHPLEEAHNDAAQLMKDQYNELVKKHLESNSFRNSIS